MYSLVPSIWEGFGLGAVEAMNAGLPIVAADIDGLREVVGEDSGILIDPHSSSEIASALRQLIASPEKRMRLGKAAFERAKTFFSRRHGSKIYRTVQSVEVMKIAVVCDLYSTFLRFRRFLVEEMIARGHEVILLAGTIDCSEDIALKELGMVLREVKMNRTGLNPLSQFGYYKRLCTVFSEFAPTLCFHTRQWLQSGHPSPLESRKSKTHMFFSRAWGTFLNLRVN